MADPHSFTRETPDFNPDRGGLRPAAAPSGFAAIPMPAYTGTHDALAALGAIEPALNSFISKREEYAAASEGTAGREAALKEAIEYGDAVKQGKIAPNQSKWFMQGYKKQFGEVLGQQWATEGKVAWTSSEAKNSDDPNAANKFIQEFTAKKLETAAGMDPDVRAGLVPHLGQMRASLQEAQATYSAHQVMEKATQNIGTLISGDIDAFINSHGTMSTDQLFANISAHDKQGRLMGIDNDSLNKEVAQAISNKARETGSLQLLDVAKKYPTVGNNPKYAAMLRVAGDAIVARKASDESRAWVQEQRVEKHNTQQLVANAYSYVIDHPGAEMPKEMLKAFTGRGIDPTALPTVMAFAKTQQTEAQKSTPAELAEHHRQIFAAGPDGLNVVTQLIEGKKIRDPEEAKSFLTLGRQLSLTGLSSEPLFKDPASRLMKFGEVDAMGKSYADPRAASDAMLAYQREWANYRASKPYASEPEKIAESQRLEEIFTTNLMKYKMTSADYTGDKYDRGAGKMPGPALSFTETNRMLHLERLQKKKAAQ